MTNKLTKIAVLCLCALAPLLMAPRDGAGNYTLPAGNPVVSGTTISSTVHNNTNSDLATAITGSLAKDGQTTPTANLPMGAFRHTNVGNATVRNQYATVDQTQDGDYSYVGAVAGTNTVTGSLAPSISAYVAGMHVVLTAANANTGATTLALNGLTALDVQKWVSGAQANIVANDLRAGVPAYLVLDTGGDDWILLNPNSGNMGDVTVGTLTATSVSTTNLTLNGNTVGGAANPSGSLGLSAVNGSATTWMRSDGAPALSQAIAPTWSASHTFTSASSAVLMSSVSPSLQWNETDAAADNRRWYMGPGSERLTLGLINDALGVATDYMTVDRTGTTVDSVAFPTEGSRVFIVGTAGTAVNSSRMQVRTTTGGAGAFMAASPTAATATAYIQNEATAGDNVFLSFGTEATGSFTQRGSIDFNRAGTLTRYNTTSDERLKKNFKPAPSARKLIDCIQIESFDWRETGAHVEHGVVAQRLNKCAPYAVSKGDVWQVDKSTLIPAMIKYMQEQDEEIKTIRTELRELASRIK